jgi:hypothetical protein
MCWEHIRYSVYVRVSQNYESVEGLLDLSIFYTFPDQIKSKPSIRNFVTSCLKCYLAGKINHFEILCISSYF